MKTPVRIHLSSPDVGAAEEEAILRAVRSGWVAPAGPEIGLFEQELAERTERGFAVALSSGTAALHLALLTLNVGPGDTVVTSTLTFAATANAVTYTGAKPFFVDCDETGNIDVNLAREAMKRLARDGYRVPVILPVDMLGKVADYPRVSELAEEFGAKVVSDAAESMGSHLNGRPAGSFGSIAAVSFNGNKIMTTSGGGALLTGSENVANQTRYLATQARLPAVHYEHRDLGYNYRLSNVLAALGRAQLSRLEKMIERRREIRETYRRVFENRPGVSILGDVKNQPAGRDDNCWLTAIILDEAESGWTPSELAHHLGARGIETRPVWKPMHLQQLYASAPRLVTGCAERLFRSGLALPSGSSLESGEIDYVAEAILDFLARYR